MGAIFGPGWIQVTAEAAEFRAEYRFTAEDAEDTVRCAKARLIQYVAGSLCLTGMIQALRRSFFAPLREIKNATTILVFFMLTGLLVTH